MLCCSFDHVAPEYPEINIQNQDEMFAGPTTDLVLDRPYCYSDYTFQCTLEQNSVALTWVVQEENSSIDVHAAEQEIWYGYGLYSMHW